MVYFGSYMTEIINQLRLIWEVQALAQSGLAYTTNQFDSERYKRLIELSAQLAQNFSNNSLDEINQRFSLEKGYATPKLDIRSFVLQDDKILLVKERADDRWSLPGGWADVNHSPSENVIRETKEESGFHVRVVRLLALWDKQRHDHPLQWPHIYKCFFHCEIISGKAQENLEISEIDFFSIDQLPDLSEDRVTNSQLNRLYQMVKKHTVVEFD